MIDVNIIEKVQKLRALTEQRGATEDEAVAAQQRMFTLLAKYNLELSEIPDDEPNKPDTTIESEHAARERSVWKHLLYGAVTRLNFSESFRRARRIVIVGTKANILASREMASYLVETVERLANQAAAKVPGDERRRYRHSFAEGCATRIYDRLEQMRLEAQAGRMKTEDANSLLPALADLYQSNKARADNFIASQFGKIRNETHYASVGHEGGYVMGCNAGDKVGLHRQVGRKHQRQIA
ncbi:MAG TPA: DUF2786 domain-containing protein [Candidatus Binataceae bacterium]|nr:DUF2786 domain-containing protein [Candidatus Binataceae bacterium]